RHAAELVALAPDVIFASGSATVGPLLRATRTVPIVFTNAPDPVGAGYVESLARPGGNITGFTPFEYGIGAKWLELLKEVAPSVTRVAAGEKARCKSRPRMNRRDCAGPRSAEWPGGQVARDRGWPGPAHRKRA